MRQGLTTQQIRDTRVTNVTPDSLAASADARAVTRRKAKVLAAIHECAAAGNEDAVLHLAARLAGIRNREAARRHYGEPVDPALSEHLTGLAS